MIIKVDGCETGSDWLAEIKAQLGVEPDTTPQKLVMYIVTAMVESTTSDKFRVNTAGQKRKIIVDKNVKGKPLLIIDGLDPDCLGGDTATGVVDEYIATKAKFGKDAYDFINALASVTHTSCQIVSMITTKCPRVAKFLHTNINGGFKCKVAKSLLCKKDRHGKEYWYSAGKFDFDRDFVGFDWSEDYKIHVLKDMFPEMTEMAIERVAHAFVDLTIRDTYLQLSDMFLRGEGLKKKLPVGEVIEVDTKCCGAFFSRWGSK